MVTEKFCMNVRAVGSDDGTHTYEIHRKWAENGKKALVIELYPTITADRCGSMDVSTMHLLNHAQELGWGEVRIVNLYSKVFSEKPKVKQLSDNDNNLSYIEELLEEQDIKDYDIVIAWGNTLVSHTGTNNSKIDLLTMMKGKGLGKQVKCIITENMDADGVHPLYLGLRYSKDVWKLKPYPIEKILHELGSGDNKAPAENDKKKPDGSDGDQTPAGADKNKAVENKKKEGRKNVSSDKK